MGQSPLATLMVLLDTHVVVWLALEPSRLSRKAKAAIETARQNNEGLAISDISLLEITSLHRKGRIQLNAGLEVFLTEIEARFIVLPISSQACARSIALPVNYPQDPADRVIGAIALVGGFTLLTADDGIRRSRVVPTLW